MAATGPTRSTGLTRSTGTASAGRPPVMIDVARLAGVSHQTVSRVLNDSPSVRAETRQRVLEAIEVLRYRPNRLARALATRGVRSVGVVTTDTLAHGPASTLLGIERAARDRGWAIVVASPAGATRGAMLAALEHVLDQGTGGLLVIAPHDGAGQALAAPGDGVPLVWVAGPAAGTELPTVRVDQAAGARLATAHLLGLGHRTVHHLAGPADWDEARERAAGWRAALEVAGAPVPAPVAGDWSAGSGYRIGRRLARRADVSAVFAANDEMAVGLLRALAEAGRRVPQDVSVIGVDDLPVSAYTLPPLTTVRQDFDELGRRAVARLAGLLTPEADPAGRADPAGGADLVPSLVIRASTAPPG